MTITCRFFARYAELMGHDELELFLPPSATVRDAIDALRQRSGGASALPETMLVAVNREHTRETHVLDDGDELAFLPPLAGG
jgi:molybdopterin synthase catalytic subunit